MSWSLLLTLAVIVFFNRYIFLEPKFAIRLPAVFQKMLQYSAPCLLVAICAPIVFFQDNQLRLDLLNPYLLSAGLCVILAFIGRHILLNLVLCLICFYTLNFFF